MPLTNIETCQKLLIQRVFETLFLLPHKSNLLPLKKELCVEISMPNIYQLQSYSCTKDSKRSCRHNCFMTIRADCVLMSPNVLNKGKKKF